MTVAAAFTPMPQANSHDLLVFLVQVGLLLGLALALGRVAVRFGLPAVVGELLTGVLLGPSLLGHAWPHGWHWLFPATPAQTNLTNAIAQLGAMLLVGVSGMHVDLSVVRRNRASTASVSLGGLLIPLAGGIALAFALPHSLLGHKADQASFALFMGVAMCVSAIPVIAKTLLDMHLLHRDVGQLTLAAGAVSDLVGWFLLSVVSAMAIGNLHGWRIGLTVAEMIALLAGVILVGRPLSALLLRLAGRSSDAGPTVAVVVVIVLGGAAGTAALGLEPAFGAFVAGVMLSSKQVRAALDPARLSALRTFALWVGGPIFLATAGLRMDLASLAHGPVLLAALAVLAVAIVGKFAGAYLGARLSGVPRREGLALGAGLNARGVVEIVIAMAGLRLAVISPSAYTIIVLVALVTSLMAPPLLRRTMAGVEHSPEERLRELEHARWKELSTPPVV